MKVESRKADLAVIEFFGDVACMDELPQYNPQQESAGQKIELLDIVALMQDIPEYNLRRGEVGTVVEILSNGDAFEVEFSDRDGRTYECRSFLASQLMVLHHEPMPTPEGASPNIWTSPSAVTDSLQNV